MDAQRKRRRNVLGKALLVFFGVIAVLGGIGCLMAMRHPEEKTRDDEENAVDLNDRFNRARYMGEDGQ